MSAGRIEVDMPVNLGTRILPCLLVSDIRRTLDFYIDVLGFVQTGYFPIESHPIRTEVRRDGVAIIFFTDSRRGLGDNPAFSGMLYVFPTSVEALAKELRGKVPFLWGPEESELGVREFAIRDPDGYVITFAEPARES
jgi:catechol 2,3-dioxygenase-like lactoylglutathione lyase family enzyme